MKKLYLMMVGVFIIACPKSTYGAASPEPDPIDWINKYPTHVRCLYVDGMTEAQLAHISGYFISLRNTPFGKLSPGEHTNEINNALERALRISNLNKNGRLNRFKKVIRAEHGYEQFISQEVNPYFLESELQKCLMEPTLSAALESVLVPLPRELNNLILEFSIWSERPIKPIP